MVDTRRTLAELATLLADNTTGDISPQDLRDFVATMTLLYGGVAMSGNTTATTISVSGTDYVTNWNSSGATTNLREFTGTTGGRLTYTGTPSCHCHVVMQCTVYVSVAASKVVSLQIYKNGSTALPGVLQLNTPGNGDFTPVAVHTDVMLATNDYLEFFVSNDTDTTDVVIHDAYVFAMGIPM